ncbi:MAG: peptidase C45 [Bacteroidetes bacterium]|nr:peptidase C45 [Bacteroidota bacterium]MBL0079252.1 peptidase C45 [Bacteroidota bacterium]
MKNKKRIYRVLIGLLLCICALIIYVAIAIHVNPPKPKSVACLNLVRTQIDTNCYKIGNNWIRKSNSGLWEMYVEGSPFEIGVISGKLSKELVQKQEAAFADQINNLIPSKFYRHFLKYFIGVFNRNLEHNLTEEEKLEIYGVSLAASPQFNYIGSPYQRMMNYHAAHDIGHALQNLALVGCSSFSTWNSKSKDSILLTGRNFDFYVGDKFAEDKIVMFCNPTKGYKFMYITWGGFTGVVSGMNINGLSVTLNASKSNIPTGSATPVSLIGREILQYAKNINEAFEIAKKRKSFVSESFMISSALDNKTIIIEKTPQITTLAEPINDVIICTNHYQSKILKNTSINKEQMEQSASVYRFERIKELLDKSPLNSPQITANILRNQLGKNDSFIGYGNEKAINQLICHHSIIFDCKHKIVWVSTNPFQLGQYISYDLKQIFKNNVTFKNEEIKLSTQTILPDNFLLSEDYKSFLIFRNQKQLALLGKEINIKSILLSNPAYYDTYVIVGNEFMKKKEFKKAKQYFEIALTKEIATEIETDYIKAKIIVCEKELANEQ